MQGPIDDIAIHRRLWTSRYAEVSEGSYGVARRKSIIFKSIRMVPVEDRQSEDIKLKKLASELQVQHHFLEPLFAGVGPDGYSFIIFSWFDTKALEYRSLSYVEGLGLFIQCLKSLEEISVDGLNFDDISLESFRISSAHNVVFLGLFSCLISQSGTSNLPNDALRMFSSPEELIGGEINHLSKIFALGVLGYTLVTRVDLSDLKQMGVNNFLKENSAPSTYGEDVPEWIDAVLGHCLKVSPEDRIKSVSDLLGYLEEGIRNGELKLDKVKWSSRELIKVNQNSVKKSSTNIPKSGPKVEQTRVDDTRATNGRTSKEGVSQSRILIYVIWFFTVCLGIGLAVYVFSALKFITMFSSQELPIGLKEIEAMDSNHTLDREVRLLADPKEHHDIRLQALNSILNAKLDTEKQLISYCRGIQLPVDFEALIQAKFIKQVSSYGYVRLKSHLEQLFKDDPSLFCKLGDIYLDALNPVNYNVNRVKALTMIFSNNSKEGIQLAGFLSIESTESLFLPELKRFLSAKGFSDIPKSFDLRLMSILETSLADVTNESTSKVLDGLNEGELKEVLFLVLKSSGAKVDSLPLLLDRYRSSLNLGARSTHLFEIASSLESSDPYISRLIILGALQMLEGADVRAYYDWADSRYEEILSYSIGIGQSEKMNETLLDLLYSRGVHNERADILLKWLKANFWADRGKYAPSLLTLAYKDLASEEEIENAFLQLMPISHYGLFDTFIKVNDPYFLLEALTRIGPIVETKVLIPYLKHDQKEVRIEVVQLLSGRNDLQTLQSILRAYRWEKDESVKEVYRKNHWVTLEREMPQNLKN